MKTTTSCLKIVILGAAEVGKSALTVRFLTKRFIGEYSSGTDHTYQAVFRYEDSVMKVEIIDSSSNTDADNHKETDADAIIVMYSVIDRRSLKQAQELLERINNGKARSNVPTLLLGNKTDLEHLRQVSYEDVILITHQYKCFHCEISVAESYSAVFRPMQELLSEGLKCRQSRLGNVKRRKSLFENVSRRLGNVFRRKSLEELLPKKKLQKMKENFNRRSV